MIIYSVHRFSSSLKVRVSWLGRAHFLGEATELWTSVKPLIWLCNLKVIHPLKNVSPLALAHSQWWPQTLWCCSVSTRDREGGEAGSPDACAPDAGVRALHHSGIRASVLPLPPQSLHRPIHLREMTWPFFLHLRLYIKISKFIIHWDLFLNVLGPSWVLISTLHLAVGKTIKEFWRAEGVRKRGSVFSNILTSECFTIYIRR